MCVELFILRDKVAVVTGAGKGLGKSMAIALAESGACVAVISRTQSEVEETAKEIRDNGGNALPLVVDVTKEVEVVGMVERVMSEYKSIDILVNNVGAFKGGPFIESTIEDWKKMLNINLTGTYLCSKIVGMRMIEKQKGKIINVSSALGVLGASGSSAYCVSKGGVIQLTRALAVEWAKYNINVNTIAPYSMETETTKSMMEDEKVKKAVLSKIPLKRLGQPSDLSCVAVFLAASASDYITGQVIFVDGGFSVQ